MVHIVTAEKVGHVEFKVDAVLFDMVSVLPPVRRSVGLIVSPSSSPCLFA
jgi:hypothetical protein